MERGALSRQACLATGQGSAGVTAARDVTLRMNSSASSPSSNIELSWCLKAQTTQLIMVLNWSGGIVNNSVFYVKIQE